MRRRDRTLVIVLEGGFLPTRECCRARWQTPARAWSGRGPDPWKPFRFKVLSSVYRDAAAGLRVLDVGCGNHAPATTKLWWPRCEYSGLDRSFDGYSARDLSALANFSWSSFAAVAYLALAATWLPLGWLMIDIHRRSAGFGLGVAWWARDSARRILRRIVPLRNTRDIAPRRCDTPRGPDTP